MRDQSQEPMFTAKARQERLRAAQVAAPETQRDVMRRAQTDKDRRPWA